MANNNKKLQQLLQENLKKAEYNRLMEALEKKYNCDKRLIENPLAIPKPDKNEGGNYKKYLQWAQILHLVYKIPLEHLNVTKEEVFDENYTGHSKAQWLRDKEVYGLTGEGPRLTGKAFEDAYLRVCEAPLRAAKKKLWIYDYLGKTDIKEPHSLDAYYDANSTLYKIIESKLTDPKGFEYIRFLALSFEVSEEFFRNNATDEKHDAEAVKHFIRLCPLALLKHICICLKEFPMFSDPNPDPGFYIVIYPPRAHHFAVLDDDCTFGEYYRWNKEGINRPELLFIESNNETSRLLTQIYSWEKEVLMKPPQKKTKLDLDLLKNNSFKALEDAEKEFNKSRDEFNNDRHNRAMNDKKTYAEREYKAVRDKHEFIQDVSKPEEDGQPLPS